MKYTGRITLLLFSIIISIFEYFFERISFMLVIEVIFFASIASVVGWSYDRSVYFGKQSENNEKHIRDLIGFSPEPILVYQGDKIVFANDKLENLLKLSSEHIIGKSIFDFILPDYHAIIKERIEKLIAGFVTNERTELKISVGASEILDIEVASALIVYNNKPSIEVFLRDVTARKQLEEKARKSEDLYRFVTENSTDIISYIKPSGDYEYMSPSCNQILGYNQDEMKGKSIFEFFHPEEIEQISIIFSDAISKIDFSSFAHRFRKKDSSFVWLETNARTIRNDMEELEGIVAVSRDITARLDRERELLDTNTALQYLSNMDGLTDIPNRRYFEHTLQNEWNRTMRHSLPLSLLMIDIDYFKNFNDFYGHPAGDKCIQQIAIEIKNTLKRPSDFVARYGGEEFIVLLPETDAQGAATVAELILSNVRNLRVQNEVSGVSNYVTISIGSATVVPTVRHNPEDLINLADTELYSAKDAGKNQAKVNMS